VDVKHYREAQLNLFLFFAEKHLNTSSERKCFVLIFLKYPTIAVFLLKILPYPSYDMA
jgi:hypothetical protein